MLFHYSDDIVKAPVHNTQTLLEEYVDTEKDVVKGSIKQYQLDIIAKEIKSSLMTDVIVRELYKVIFVCPPLAEKNLENIYVHEERTAGFKEAVKKIHGLEYVIIGNWDYQKQAKKELEKSEKKTAFLCTGDMFALNLIRMFEKNGKRAGQDYGIMGYDNIDFLEYVTPRLTTIDNHVEKVAEEAFNLLLQLMENKNVAETERILETVTVQGETI